MFQNKKKYKEDYLESDRELQAKKDEYLQLDREHLQNIPVPLEKEKYKMQIIKQITDFEQAEKEILDISILSEKEEQYKQLNFMISLYHDRIIDSCRAGFNLITKILNQYIRNEIDYDKVYRIIGNIRFDIDLCSSK